MIVDSLRKRSVAEKYSFEKSRDRRVAKRDVKIFLIILECFFKKFISSASFFLAFIIADAEGDVNILP